MNCSSNSMPGTRWNYSHLASQIVGTVVTLTLCFGAWHSPHLLLLIFFKESTPKHVRHTSEIVELYSYPLKSLYSSVNSNDDELQVKNTGELDLTDARKCLTGSILRDDKATLMIQLKQFLETSLNQNIFKEDENRDAELLDHSIASKLLRLCCMFDSVECASALISREFGTVPRVNELDDNGRSALHTAAEVHTTRCIELLLRKCARTDLKSKDGRSQLALELSLSSRR